ncbi:MAG: hypothetical protein VYC19_11185 [Pseudomonadota bacterium]|jgi:hypothetical protein|nr:hypothetical protein [Alphaproteobacteria bacterium]MEC7703307.1 hypothetical protein [Pseudomonadota bacterium]MEE3323401.1 hypothetical protein [Pseudomonadota bacterium]
MGIASWIVGNHIDDIFEEIEDHVKEKGIEIDFDGAGDLAKFAIDLKDTMDDKGQEIQARFGTSLKGTFEKAVGYSFKAIELDGVRRKMEEARENGNNDLADELEDKLDDLEDDLEDLEEDILDDYKNLDENVDIEPIKMQRNYDSEGNLVNVSVEVDIENTNNGESVEMETEINIDNGQISKVNVGFDI